MSHILHYVIALTFTILGLQLQKPEKIESLNVLSKITERIQSDNSAEKDLISSDCIQIEKEFALSKKIIVKTKRIE